ncbi:hypothetical protein [Flavobacterium sp. ENC]|uniref:hypothetical protein n=1 Tax=Flavobacterium sp. ENC TaxID=2897330 RepID=UPI001E5F8F11|nr:hypothetical protein [Flavobacterium sp. ENC]MCD0467707.1 hypothetical protein [Flavobacterium sp. ENC]
MIRSNYILFLSFILLFLLPQQGYGKSDLNFESIDCVIEGHQKDRHLWCKARLLMHNTSDLNTFTILSRPDFEGTKIEFKYTVKNV